MIYVMQVRFYFYGIQVREFGPARGALWIGMLLCENEVK
jgi:hypothetical protein